jgi:hypothetical protein
MKLLQLFEAVLTRDTGAVVDFLQHYHGKTGARNLALVYAAATGQAEMVDQMLQLGLPLTTFDVLTSFRRRWESRQLKKLQRVMEYQLRSFTRGWSPVLTPACAAAFYGHQNVLDVLLKYPNGKAALAYNPYQAPGEHYLGKGTCPCWNAVTCALFGRQWDIADTLVSLGLVTTDMPEQYPRFLQFRYKVRLPDDVIKVVFSFLQESKVNYKGVCGGLQHV